MTLNLSDEDIVNEVRAGKSELFSMLVERYQKPIYNLMYRYTRNVEDAADLTQEVFLQSFSKLHTFSPGGKFFSWLYAIGLNKGKDWRGRFSRGLLRTSLPENDLRYDADIQQPQLLEKIDEGRLVVAALEKLDPESREILILRYRHECPVKEIAAIFTISESAAKMRISRGLKRLQKIYLRDNPGEKTDDGH